MMILNIFFFQAEDGIRYRDVTGVQTCALPISRTQRPHRRVAVSAAARSLAADSGLGYVAGYGAQTRVRSLQIGRASCRERELITVGAVTGKKKKMSIKYVLCDSMIIKNVFDIS